MPFIIIFMQISAILGLAICTLALGIWLCSAAYYLAGAIGAIIIGFIYVSAVLALFTWIDENYY